MKLHLHCQKCCLKHPKTIKDNERISKMCYKNAILTLTNWNHPWLGFMAKLHTQRGLRGFLLDEPPADWSNHKWKDHEASNGKNMSCNCFPGVLLLRHSLIGRRPWRLQIFGKTSLGCLYHVYLQGTHVTHQLSWVLIISHPVKPQPFPTDCEAHQLSPVERYALIFPTGPPKASRLFRKHVPWWMQEYLSGTAALGVLNVNTMERSI